MSVICIWTQALCRTGIAFPSSLFSLKTNSKYWTRDVQKVTSRGPAPSTEWSKWPSFWGAWGNCQLHTSFTFVLQGCIFYKQDMSISQESAVLHIKSMHSLFLYCRRVCIGNRQKKVKKRRSRTRSSSARVPDHLCQGQIQQIITEYLVNSSNFYFPLANHQLETTIFFCFCESVVSLQVTQQLSGAKRLAWQKPRE